jgi:hypothetical protein
MIEPSDIEANFEFDDNENYPLTFDTPEQLNAENEAFDDEDDFIYDQPATNFEDITESLSDIDFSEMRGDFRSSMKSINKKIDKKSSTNKGQRVIRKKGSSIKPKKRKKPLTQEFGVGRSNEQGQKGRAKIMGGKKQLAKVIVPRDRKVIVEGVSKFILSDGPQVTATKNIGYYKGKKLLCMVLTINNQTGLDFNIDFFDPSFPLNYLFNTSQNINDMVSVANSPTSYTDVLFNLLANPTMIVNARCIVSGPQIEQQINQSLIFQNKNIEGKEKINPYNIFLSKDAYQFQNTTISFDIMGGLNRPFIPDGMDVARYKVLKDMSVTFGFYYKQVSLKKFFYKEAREHKGLL